MHKYIDSMKEKVYKLHKPNNQKPKKRFSKIIRFFFFCLYAVLGLVAVGIAAMLIYISTIPLPDISNFDKRIISQSTKVYDRTGQILLFDAHNAIRRTVVDLNNINPNIQRAAIAIEDDQFYKHNGIRIKSIIRAVYATVFKGDTQGGSTLTQQIVKNTLLTKEQSLTRKIKEAIIAIRLEQKLTKDELLEIYLNEAPYSGNIYGVEEAAEVYFKKSAKDVTLFEAAYLAAIPKGPTYYNPSGPNKTKLDERAKYVLKRMEDLGYITYEQRQGALATPVIFVEKAQTPIKAPHFVMYIRDYLEKKYGKDMVDNQGLKVISTLDYELQSYAEEEALKEALKNEKEYGGKNIAMVAMDPNNGQILSMVGSRDFFDEKIDGQFNVTTASRQPGSSFKPFVYATAFKKGFRPETILFDVFTEFNTNCSPDGKGNKCYSPDNFDSKFKGPMMLKNALAESRNIPAVKLIYLAGVQETITTARSMGITTLKNGQNYGLPLALGAGEVKLVDIVNGYSVFAANGIYHPIVSILRIEDKSGKVLEEYKDNEGSQVLPDYVANGISQILSSNELRTPTFGTNSSLYTPGINSAVKTGTTNSNKDAWTVGYTPKIAVGVWVGNNDNIAMKKGGAQLAGPLFNKIITKYTNKVGDQAFSNIPFPNQGGSPVLRGLWQGGKSFFIDSISGGLATENTPEASKKEKVITDVHTILHWVDTNNITGPAPTNPQKDPQYTNWEYGVRAWYNRNGAPFVNESDIPDYEDNIHTQSISIPFQTIGITEDQEFKPTDTISLSIETIGHTIKNSDIFIDSKKIKNTGISPIARSINIKKEGITPGNHTLKIVVYDELLNKGEDTISFKITNLSTAEITKIE